MTGLSVPLSASKRCRRTRSQSTRAESTTNASSRFPSEGVVACGSGIESGVGEAAAYWGWISTTVARDTKVSAYDRAGRGWSEPAAAAQDGIAVATDLHMLLDRGHVTGPFVLVGHSSGAEYSSIFAGR